MAAYGSMGLGLWLVVYPSDDLPHMHLGVAIYTLFLAASAALMGTVACWNRHFLTMGLGAALFFISDGFLGVRLFQDNRKGIGDLCWITDGIGQMLIVFGAIRVS